MAGTPAGAFRVVKERMGPARPVAARPGGTARGRRDDAARVSLADVALAVMPDRSVLGRRLYEVVPESGRLLTVELPAGSTILWAAVEPNPAAPLRAGPVGLVDRAGLRPAGARLPDLEDPGRRMPRRATRAAGRSRCLGPVRARPGPCCLDLDAAGPDGRGDRRRGSSGPRWRGLEKARADGLEQSLREALARLDRSSGRDHERLVSLLINHELALRVVERAAHREDALRRARSDRASCSTPSKPPGRVSPRRWARPDWPRT